MHFPLRRHYGSREAGLAPVAVALTLLALVIIAFLLLPPATAGAQELAPSVLHPTHSTVEAMRTSLT